jgi:hypothetical protein
VELETGAIRRLPFRFDTGADLTIIPGDLEPELNLDSPGVWKSIKMTTAVGEVTKRIVRGRFRTRLPGFGDEDFEWPCALEEGNPDRYLIGMAGVINGPNKRLKVAIDSTLDGISFPAGRFTVEVVRE